MLILHGIFKCFHGFIMDYPFIDEFEFELEDGTIQIFDYFVMFLHLAFSNGFDEFLLPLLPGLLTIFLLVQQHRIHFFILFLESFVEIGDDVPADSHGLLQFEVAVFNFSERVFHILNPVLHCLLL